MDMTIKDLQKFRAKEELKIKLLQVINIMLSNDDIINVLSSMIVRRTE
jgi:hypothetical protein